MFISTIERPGMQNNLHTSSTCFTLLFCNQQPFLYAQILCQIIVSINSLRAHFTECRKFIINWQFGSWQEGEWMKNAKTKQLEWEKEPDSQSGQFIILSNFTDCCSGAIYGAKKAPPPKPKWLIVEESEAENIKPAR